MEPGLHPVAGGACALGSAAAWAIASLIFARLGKRASPLSLNLGKGLISLAVLGVILAVVGFGSLPPAGWGILALSGLIGIGFGDTVYFAALIRMGPRKMLVVTTLVPVAASALAMIFLDERPTWSWAIGGTLCLSGVAWVMWERLPSESEHERDARQGAVVLGLATVALEALGTFLSKVGMSQGGTAGFLEATFVRLLAGVIGVAVFGLVRGTIVEWTRAWFQPGFLRCLVSASLLGTLIGIGLAMAALWLTDVSIASILNATAPLFVLPLAVFVLKERVSPRAALGALAAVGGVAVLFVPT